jgi:PAS domain S-box-containing protein
MSPAQSGPLAPATKQTGAEQDELSRLANALPMAVARLDSGERFRFSNDAYNTWCGLSGQAHYGRPIREVLDEKSYEELESHLREALAGNPVAFASAVHCRNGIRREVQIHLIPIRSSEAVEGVHIVMTDITKQLQTQAEVQRLNTELERRVNERTAQLEATNRELEAFCYSVSHDLRAPLRSVRGFTEVLLEQYASQLDSRGQDFLRRVSDASSQMDKLVDDLLRLSRVSRSEIQSQEINLSQLAEEVVLELKRAEPARAVEVQIQPDLKTQGDARLLRLVLDTLFRNSWKFSGKRADARVEFGFTGDSNGAFFVRDNGVGFDMAYADRLFGVFQRLHSANEYPGSGVGLAIVQRVINRHGGRVWAEGKVNSGATFYFALPPAFDY